MLPQRSTATTRRIKLYKELKAKLAELRGQGEGPVVQIAEGPALAFKAATKKQPWSTPKIRACHNCAPNSASPKTLMTPNMTRRSPPPSANFRRAPISRPTGVLDDRTVKAHQQPEA